MVALLAKLYDGSGGKKTAEHDEVLLDSWWIKEGYNKRRQHCNSLYLFILFIFVATSGSIQKTCLDLPRSVLDALFSDQGVAILHTHTIQKK